MVISATEGLHEFLFFLELWLHSSLGYRPPAPQTQIPKIIHNEPTMIQ